MQRRVKNGYVLKAYLCVIILCSIVVIQFASGIYMRRLEFGESEINNVIVLSRITIGMASIILLRDKFYDIEFWVNILLMFIIVFCSYFIITEAISGISLERDSAGFRYSKNHVSAVVYTVSPLLLYYKKSHNTKKKNKYINCALVLSLLTILASSSRTGYAAIAIILSTSIFAFAGAKLFIISIIGILGTVCAGFFLRTSTIIRRGMAFSAGLDSTRRTLEKLAIEKFHDFNTIERLFGSGSNKVFFARGGGTYVVHCFFLELLLSFGIIGFLVLMGFIINLLVRVLKNVDKDGRIFVLQEIFMTGVTAFIQPIYTSSYLCAFFFYVVIMTIFEDQGRGTGPEIQGHNYTNAIITSEI